jgi:hypothetical protein
MGPRVFFDLSLWGAAKKQNPALLDGNRVLQKINHSVFLFAGGVIIFCL